MSSREIAERTGKEHKDVMRDIRVMLEQLGETSAQFCAHLPDSYGRPQPVFLLPKDLTITLVAGYSAPLRHRIVTRWMELEEAQATPKLPNFKNPAEAARAWALAYEQAAQAALQTFNTPFSTQLRVIDREGQPWFIAKDVCDALDTDTKDVRANLDSAEVSTLKVPGQPGRPALLVNESGFYKLVLKSRKPEARKFQDWVTGVVLPAIRKNGGYVVGQEKLATGEMAPSLNEIAALSR